MKRSPVAYELAPVFLLLIAFIASSPAHASEDEANEEVRILRGHKRMVTDVAISADGRIAASVDYYAARVWDANTGEELHAFDSRAIFHTVSISGDGRLVLVGDARNLRLWDIESGEELWSIPFGLYGQATLSGNGQYVLASTGRTIRVLNASDGAELRTINPKGFAMEVTSLAISHDGSLATTFHSENLFTWDLESGERLNNVKPMLRGVWGGFAAMTLSTDGRRALVANLFALHLWDLEGKRKLRSFHPKSPVPASMGVAFGSNDRIALSNSRSKIRLWDVETGELLHTLRGHRDNIYDVDMSADARRVVSGSHDRTVRIWPLPSFAK